jgi:hypothetical protein
MSNSGSFRIRIGGATNVGWSEIATANDSAEAIYVRQYSSNFATLTRTLTLLDASGNTTIPGNVLINTTDNGIDKLQVNGSTKLNGNTTINGILNITPTITASLAIARGANLTPALSASANNDVLVGLDINTTFNNGSFSGVITAAARIKGNLQFSPVSGATAQDWKIYADIEDNNASRTALYIAGAFGGGARVYIGSSSAQAQALNLRYCSNIENAPTYTVGSFSIGNQSSHSILRATNNVVYSATGPSSNHIWFGGPNFSQFNEYMRLTTIGNLLIGTATDNGIDRLQVQGSTNLNGNTTITGSLNVSVSILQNGGALALQDGIILYHSVKWFTPSSTVSTNGTTVTSVGTQFTSTMVGAKLTINGESRIITGYTSTTVVTVANTYSQNYSGVVVGSWGVFSKSFTQSPSDNPNLNGGFEFRGAQNNSLITAVYDRIQVGLRIADGGNNVSFNTTGTNNVFQMAADKNLVWYSGFSSANNALNTIRDTGIRKNSVGVLEIFDGINTNGLEENRRDLLVRNTLASKVVVGTTVDNGIDALQVSGSASFTSNITARDGIFNGNVGIGTGSSAITAKLHINGRLLIVSDGETATFGNLNYTTKYLQVRDGSNYAVRWGLQANNNITNSGTALMMSSKTISFKANAGSTLFENVLDPDLIINSDGIGIGTTNALTRGGTAKLSVVITSSEPIVYGRSNTDAIFLRRISTGSYQFQTTANGGDTGNLFLQPYGGDILIGTTVDNGVDILQVNGSASFSSSIKVGDNTAAASSANAGSIRYRETANGSFSEMSMRTGTSTYAWVIQISNNF